MKRRRIIFFSSIVIVAVLGLGFVVSN